MNVPELIVWLIPGYLALSLYRHVNPSRSKQGWEWVFSTAGAALVCFLVARVVLLLLTVGVAGFANGAVYISETRSWWSSHFPFRYSFSLLLGFVLGVPITAALLCIGRSLWDGLERKYDDWFAKAPSRDIFYFTCTELKAKKAREIAPGEEQPLVVVTLTNGKVYVGSLMDFTDDPDESNRLIKILPGLSGHRDKDTQQVIYTTNYFNTESPEAVTVQEILIPASLIVTLGRFDKKLHDLFIRLGTTVVTTYAELKAGKQTT